MVWHHSLPLMNSFYKIEAAVFSCRLCFLRAFPFISLILGNKQQRAKVMITNVVVITEALGIGSLERTLSIVVFR